MDLKRYYITHRDENFICVDARGNIESDLTSFSVSFIKGAHTLLKLYCTFCAIGECRSRFFRYVSNMLTSVSRLQVGFDDVAQYLTGECKNLNGNKTVKPMEQNFTIFKSSHPLNNTFVYFSEQIYLIP